MVKNNNSVSHEKYKYITSSAVYIVQQTQNLHNYKHKADTANEWLPLN